MKLKVIVSVISLLIAAGVGTAVYFIYFTPEAQARRLADSVMQAASAQDIPSYDEMTKSLDQASTLYEQSRQRNYRFDQLVTDGPAYHIRYIFTDEVSPTQARISVSHGRVTSLSVGDELGATPDDDTTQRSEDIAQNFCLTREDLAFLDSTRLYAHTFRGATMIFSSDTSAEYAGQENGDKLLDRMRDFYKKTSEKDYSFLIRGYLASSSESADQQRQVNQNRATLLRQELTSREIPDDRIRIGEPVAYDPTQSGDANQRYAIIDVVNNCNK